MQNRFLFSVICLFFFCFFLMNFWTITCAELFVLLCKLAMQKSHVTLNMAETCSSEVWHSFCFCISCCHGRQTWLKWVRMWRKIQRILRSCRRHGGQGFASEAVSVESKFASCQTRIEKLLAVFLIMVKKIDETGVLTRSPQVSNFVWGFCRSNLYILFWGVELFCSFFFFPWAAALFSNVGQISTLDTMPRPIHLCQWDTYNMHSDVANVGRHDTMPPSILVFRLRLSARVAAVVIVLIGNHNWPAPPVGRVR